ncbi:hypothetical protein EVAR_92780_1 [Eumeta japonica]|uniref:Uncharacterized protein n=1 Tax=Eumeta variegata TaxID=151549 RepID=A0A4C1T062_EUMVA|nr:hypothetical protein EVAR_92780_1 [Eumeta japonica]
MGDARLSGLCMLSVHRKRVEEDTEFVDKVINQFGRQPRGLQFLFKQGVQLHPSACAHVVKKSLKWDERIM